MMTLAFLLLALGIVAGLGVMFVSDKLGDKLLAIMLVCWVLSFGYILFKAGA